MPVPALYLDASCTRHCRSKTGPKPVYLFMSTGRVQYFLNIVCNVPPSQDLTSYKKGRNTKPSQPSPEYDDSHNKTLYYIVDFFKGGRFSVAGSSKSVKVRSRDRLSVPCPLSPHQREKRGNQQEEHSRRVHLRSRDLNRGFLLGARCTDFLFGVVHYNLCRGLSLLLGL